MTIFITCLFIGLLCCCIHDGSGSEQEPSPREVWNSGDWWEKEQKILNNLGYSEEDIEAEEEEYEDDDDE